MTPILRLRSWLESPVVFARWHILAAALLFATTGMGVWFIDRVNVNRIADERSARSAAERRALEERLSDRILNRRELEGLARRVARQEQPTERELVRRLARDLRLLRERPALRERFRRELGLDPTPVVAPTTTDRSAPRPPSPGRRRRGGRPRPAPPSSSSPSSPGSPSPSAPSLPSPPSPARPPIEVQTPDGLPLPAPSVCLPLIGVNCS